MTYAVQLIDQRHAYLGVRMVGSRDRGVDHVRAFPTFKGAAELCARMVGSMHPSQAGACYRVVPLPLYGITEPTDLRTIELPAPAHPMRAKAERLGFTRLVQVECGDGTELDLAVAPDCDFDGRFRGLCLETGELLSVSGWLAYLHDDAEARAAMAARYWDWRG
jgi:hypothetical protein